jgi:hypothetical protein
MLVLAHTVQYIAYYIHIPTGTEINLEAVNFFDMLSGVTALPEEW